MDSAHECSCRFPATRRWNTSISRSDRRQRARTLCRYRLHCSRYGISLDRLLELFSRPPRSSKLRTLHPLPACTSGVSGPLLYLRDHTGLESAGRTETDDLPCSCSTTIRHWSNLQLCYLGSYLQADEWADKWRLLRVAFHIALCHLHMGVLVFNNGRRLAYHGVSNVEVIGRKDQLFLQTGFGWRLQRAPSVSLMTHAAIGVFDP